MASCDACGKDRPSLVTRESSSGEADVCPSGCVAPVYTVEIADEDLTIRRDGAVWLTVDLPVDPTDTVSIGTYDPNMVWVELANVQANLR